jgi:subtilisin family serine protease
VKRKARAERKLGRALRRGTHVASTVGSTINGLGMAGVAPNVTLVNLRAGQDSVFFFLQASVDALTYAGDHGIDVANMSYFIDP